MGEIIQFPFMDEKHWRETESSMRKIFVSFNFSNDSLDFAFENLKKVFLKAHKLIQIQIEAPQNEEIIKMINCAVQKTASEFQQPLFSLLTEILLREIEIYNYKHPITCD